MNDFSTNHLKTNEQRIIAQAVLRALPRNPSGGGCQAFWTPEGWRERQEEYGLDSVLILVHDGGDLARFCNPAYGDQKAMQKLTQSLRDAGYWVEQCTSWYSAIYAI